MLFRSKTRLVKCLALCAIACAGAARAAHPLQTEDTGTQGAGNIELENGFDASRAGAGRNFSYQPQLSYGLAPSFDLIVQPTWLRQRDASGSTVQGWGDTNFDAKWRFLGSAPFSLAVRAGLTAPTASEPGLGIPRGRVAGHALLVATYDAAPFTVHGNLGLSRQPSDPGGPPARRQIAELSGALMWALSEQLILTVDGGAEQNGDPARKSWPAKLLVGAIWTLRPGLDADVGYQSSLNAADATGRARELLFGLTYRFAP